MGVLNQKSAPNLNLGQQVAVRDEDNVPFSGDGSRKGFLFQQVRVHFPLAREG